MDQLVQPISPDHSIEIEAKRTWVREHYTSDARSEYETVAGKVAVVSLILSSGWVGSQDTLELQCLGIAFGDALAQYLSLEWVSITDEYGQDPALSLPGTSLLLFPMTMISKRVEEGEVVDVPELFQTIVASVQDAQRST